ncbi:MAG: LysR substrate-binding domain-containing protein [Pseudomonadota bacterium]
MGSQLPPPAWLKTFEAAARLGGFAAAAEELGLTPAAVSQQIRALEGRLGFQLFHRQARGVVLSEVGRSYLPAVQQAFETLSLATAGLFGLNEAERLIVRAPVSFATQRLAPVLPDFHDAHPGIPIRLSTSVWSDALEEDQADIEIRYGDGKWPGQQVIRLSEPGSIPICPPGTNFGSDPLAAIAAMMQRDAIHIMGCESFWTLFARAHSLAEDRISARSSVDSSTVAIEMVAAGLGVALIAQDLAARAVSDGRVVCPPGLRLSHEQAHHAVIPRHKAPRPEALLFAAWLSETFAPAPA